MYILAAIALLYLAYIHPREQMTNKDVDKKQDFHEKKPTTWEMPAHKKPVKMSERPKPSGLPILGPEIPEIDPNDPQPTIGKGGDKGVYPDIYGPESLKAPGHKDSNKEYDFPAGEFPAGPDEPEPYLNDFSKMLKM
jgi:hypothetical protein